MCYASTEQRIVGLDHTAAKAAVSKYLENTQFTANQIRFVEQIIDLLTQQDVMNRIQVCDGSLTDLHSDSLDGLFQDDNADNIIAIIRSFNETVSINFGTA